MKKTLNALLAIICFFGGLGVFILGLTQAPIWVVNVLFGLFLVNASKEFMDNVRNDK